MLDASSKANPRRLLTTAIGLVFFLTAFACSTPHASGPAKPPIGDFCLVGAWVLQHEENRSGYMYAGTAVPVTGMAGAKLSFGSDGLETYAFDGSAPLVGTAPDGRVLSITVTSSVTFHIHADVGQYTETGTVTNLPTVATIGRVTIADYQSHYAPGTGTYKCAGKSLTTAGSTGVQTDTWSRP